MQIVLSAACRKRRNWKEISGVLKKAGYVGPKIMDKTGIHMLGRGVEIKEWLEQHPECDKFAIVDDDTFDMADMLSFVVKTSLYTGMLERHANELIEKLR